MADVSSCNEKVLATVFENECSFRAYFTWRRFAKSALWAIVLGFVARSEKRGYEEVR